MASTSPPVPQRQNDPNDLTQRYNTPLNASEEKRFEAWAAKAGRTKDLYDYDLRGAWKADAQQASNGHLPDTWKKPNHPTFSDESRYSNASMPGGKWVQQGNKWQFRASHFNVQVHGVDGLQEYFKDAEPDATLMVPTPDAQLFYGHGRQR